MIERKGCNVKLVEFTVKRGIETFRVAVDSEHVFIVSEIDPDNEKTSPNRTMLGTKSRGR